MQNFVVFELPGLGLVVHQAALLVLGNSHRDCRVVIVDLDVLAGKVRRWPGPDAYFDGLLLHLIINE